MKKLIVLGIVAAMVVGIQSCKKEEEKEEEYDNSSAPQSNAVIETAYDEMTNMSDQAITGTMVFYKSDQVTVIDASKKGEDFVEKTDCNVIITLDTTGTDKTITIDWGTSNCTCNDGKTRRGKIVTTFTGKYRDAGTVITHTPVDYYVNDNKIEGTKTVENMGLNASNQPFFNVSINGTATMTNGDVFTYSSTRVRTWVAGSSTGIFNDDEYDITGSANASSTNGNGYSASITAPVHIKVGCAYPTKGTISITPLNKPVRVIDYGTGDCDQTFTVTVNGHVHTING